jgi:hypothetical protein
MKGLLIILGVIAVVTVFVVYALSESMAPGDFEDLDLGVTGALARGAVSEVRQPIKVWTRPRQPATRKEREEMLVGELRRGDRFVILNHFQKGDQQWFQAMKEGNESFKGWMFSPATDPIDARRVN